MSFNVKSVLKTQLFFAFAVSELYLDPIFRYLDPSRLMLNVDNLLVIPSLNFVCLSSSEHLSDQNIDNRSG